MLDLYEELKSVIDALDGAEIGYAIAGGLAFSFYVEPRATVDIDLVLLPENWHRVKEILRPLGYEEYATPMEVANGEMVIRRLTKLEAGGSDIMVLDFLMAESGVLKDAWQNRVAYDSGERKIWLVSRKYLIRLKRLRSSKQDLLDIEKLEEKGNGDS